MTLQYTVLANLYKVLRRLFGPSGAEKMGE